MTTNQTDSPEAAWPLTKFVLVGAAVFFLVFFAWIIWPRQQSLEIHTVPAGAEVRLDNELVGTSPVQVATYSRKATITAALPGYEEATLEYDRSGFSEPLKMVLQPLPATCSVQVFPSTAKVQVRDSETKASGEGSERTVVITKPKVGQELTLVARLPGHDERAKSVTLGPGVKKSIEFRFPALMHIETSPALSNVKLNAETEDSAAEEIRVDVVGTGKWLLQMPTPRENSTAQLDFSLLDMKLHREQWRPSPGEEVRKKIELPLAIYDMPKWPNGLRAEIRSEGGVVVKNPTGSPRLVVFCPAGQRTVDLDLIDADDVVASYSFPIPAEQISAEPARLPVAMYQIVADPPETTLQIEGPGALTTSDNGRKTLLVFNPDGRRWVKLKAECEDRRSVHQLITPTVGARETISISLPDLSRGFERVLPSDIVFFVNVSDYGSFKERLFQLRGVQLCQDEVMKPFVDSFVHNFQESVDQWKAESGIDIVQLCAAHTGQICVAATLPRGDDQPAVGYFLSEVPGNRDVIQSMLDHASEILLGHGYKRRDEGDLRVFTGKIPSPVGGPDLRSFTVTNQDVLVAGSDPARLTDAITKLANPDPAASDAGSLAANPRLAAFRERTGGVGDFEAFADLAAIISSDSIGIHPSSPITNLEAAGLSFSIREKEFDTKLQLVLNTKPQPDLVLGMPPADLKPEPWVPADVVAYGSLSIDVNRFLKNRLDADLAGFIAFVLAPYLEPLGNRVTFLIGDIQNQGGISVPRALVAWKHNNADKARKMLETIGLRTLDRYLFKRGTPYRRETIAGHDLFLTKTTDSPDIEFEVAFTVTDTHLLIGERRLVERVLTHRGPSLADDPEYRRVVSMTPESKSGVWFYRSTQQFRFLHAALKSGLAESLQVPQWPGVKPLLEALNGEDLPEHGAIRDYQLPSGGFLMMDESGIHAVYFTLREALGDGGEVR